MSIEKKLMKEFQHHSEHLSCPPSLDTRISALYRDHILEKRGRGNMHKTLFFKRGVIITLLLIILSGFAYGGTLLFQTEKENISIDYTAYADLSLDKTTLEKVRNSLREVHNQLQSGETAVVYFSELDQKNEMFENMPLLTVAKPMVINQKQDWNQVLIRNDINVNIPDTVIGTYHFTGGMKGLPFGAFIGMELIPLKEELKAESKETGKNVVWRKVSNTNQPVVESYTMIYQDEHQDKIYYTLQLANEKIILKGMVPESSLYEIMDINENQAYYMKEDQFMYGDSSVNQSIMWITTRGDQTFLNTVSTDFKMITKEQLKEAAKSF